MNNNDKDINSAAIATDESAVMGTVESNNPTTSENNEVYNETPVEISDKTAISNQLTEEEKQKVLGELKKGQSVSYEEFIGTCRLALDPRQRPTHDSNVKRLMKCIKSCDGAVIEPIKVAPVLPMVSDGEKLFLDGKQITVDTPDIDRIYVILDGGHRYEAIERLMKENPEMLILCKVETPDIPSGMSYRQYQDIINNERCGWTPSDRMNSVVKKIEGDGETICQYMNLWYSEYGIGLRLGYALFHFKDGYRKELLINSQNGELDEDLRGTPEQIADGKQMFDSLLVGCNGEKKLFGTLAPAKAIINLYDRAGKNKTEIVENLKIALKAIDENDREQLRACNNPSEREAEFGRILKIYLDLLESEDSKSKVILKAKSNADAYRKRLNGQNKKESESVNDTLKNKLGLKKLTGNLTTEFKALLDADDAEQVVSFIKGLTEKQVVDIRAYGKDAAGGERLNEVITKSWNEFVGNQNQNN